jgi:hypothetical protein
MELTMAEKKKIMAQTAPRYRKGNKKTKGQILDEFIALTGYNRKYAIHVLAHEGKVTYRRIGGKLVALKAQHAARKKRKYAKLYDEAVHEKLFLIWKNFSWQCGKLLAPFLRENLTVLRLHTDYLMSDEVAVKLGRISPASIDRLLKKDRAKYKIRGTCGTKAPKKKLAFLVPTQTWFECAALPPGFFQVDLVFSDGGTAAGGDHCYTLTMTDASTGWTRHYALKNKASRWIREALEKAVSAFPFPFRGIHSDNGSEFLNHALYQWCREKHIVFTKSRVQRKNDNCYVEQKNFATVRKIIGYARFEGEEATSALQAVYDAHDTLLNYFYHCMKLVSKERTGAKVKKKYDAAKTPFQRALEHPQIDPDSKLRLLDIKASLNLIDLQHLFEKAQNDLAKHIHEVPVLNISGWKPKT